MLEIGSVIDGRYKILNQIGKGGMSCVYLAMNEKANKPWAVKEIRNDGTKDYEVVREGLIAEMDILRRLKHPNLPSIVDVIDDRDSFIIIMDYVEGNSLNEVLEEFGAQRQDDVINWAIQICDVLDYIHTRKPPIIYRDMKPGNIMLTPEGKVVLIDFGTAREFKEMNLTDTTNLGTLGYAAPEQLDAHKQTDARTDIYGLGATMYHLVTGLNPSYGMRPIREVNPSLSEGLEQIILKCTEREPDDRYQSAAELMYALKHYNEIDEKYRNKQLKKLGLFIASGVLTLVFAAVSAWGYTAAQGRLRQDYDYILANAASVQDYYDAIRIAPARTEAYLGTEENPGLVAFLMNDGELSPEDNAVFTELRTGIKGSDDSGTTDVLSPLKAGNPSGYEEVCYEIGENYLIYYNTGVERDNYAAAAAWFQYIEDSNPLARLYCVMATCLQNIAKYSRAEQYANLYEEYEYLWDQVNTLRREAENYDDDFRLRIWDEIVVMIRDNTEEFCRVASREDILGTLDSIEKKSQLITNNYLQDGVEKLQQEIADAKQQVRAADGETGQGG